MAGFTIGVISTGDRRDMSPPLLKPKLHPWALQSGKQQRQFKSYSGFTISIVVFNILAKIHVNISGDKRKQKC